MPLQTLTRDEIDGLLHPDRRRDRSPNSPRARCHPGRTHRARGMCTSCYFRWRDLGTGSKDPDRSVPADEEAPDAA